MWRGGGGGQAEERARACRGCPSRGATISCPRGACERPAARGRPRSRVHRPHVRAAPPLALAAARPMLGPQSAGAGAVCDAPRLAADVPGGVLTGRRRARAVAGGAARRRSERPLWERRQAAARGACAWACEQRLFQSRSRGQARRDSSGCGGGRRLFTPPLCAGIASRRRQRNQTPKRKRRPPL